MVPSLVVTITTNLLGKNVIEQILEFNSIDKLAFLTVTNFSIFKLSQTFKLPVDDPVTKNLMLDKQLMH